MAALRIGLISDSVIANDPRLRRQGDALTAAGYDVIGVGLPGADLPTPGWQLETIPLRSTIEGPHDPRASSRLRKVQRTLDIPRQLLRPAHAYDVYWRLNTRYRALAQLAERQNVDLWIANDWATLPIVMAIQQRTGTSFGYDTHELAIDELAQNLKWRLSMRPLIVTIERAGLATSAFATCVSNGIASRLQEFYQLDSRPTVIRNMPPHEAGAFRPTDEHISVLYHGVIIPGRALEECIASVALWRPEFSLTLRGPGDPAYIAGLKQLARQLGVDNRIAFAPPVPMTALVEMARLHDVGLFAIKGHSRQNQYVLPNKLFEYAMAGLALCVSNLPEMSHVLEEHQLGHVIAEVRPQSIADAINALDRALIDAFKANALSAAKKLCWEHESGKMVDLVRNALRASRPFAIQPDTAR